MKGNNIKSIYFFLIILFILIIFKNNKNYEIGLNKELRNQKKKMKIIEKYFKICNNGIVLNKNEFKKVKEPKISIISPIYNKEKSILRFLRSIQNQFFDDIEIILIDDHSKDNTIKIIENIQKEDERIILIKHNENKGTLISRNEGAIISKSKYLIFADPDDILSNDVLSFSYETIEKNNYDIVRYNIYIGNNKISLDSIVNEIKSKPIYQPELSLYIFYGTGELIQNDYFIWNKIIKRKIFIYAINLLNNYYLQQYMIDCEDGLINFILYKTAKSYFFIKKIGYYYILNDNSITLKSRENLKKTLKSNFLYFKFMFENTKNNKIEKKIAEYIFCSIYENYKSYIYMMLKEIKEDLQFYKDVINLYLNNDYISLKTKIIFIKIKYNCSLI